MLTEPVFPPTITPDRPWPYKPMPRASSSTAWARLVAGISHLAVPIPRWHRTRRDRRLLMTLSDHMLQDLGLSRGEIEGAVRIDRDPI